MSLAVLAFAEEQAPAARLAAALGVPFRSIGLHRFPDGESLPTAPSPPRTAILYRSLDRPDAKLAPLLLAADALRRGGAQRIVLVAPYFCYLRQDRVFEAGQPLSRDVIAPLIGGAVDRIVTVEAHLHRTADLSAATGVPSRSLTAVPVLVPLFEAGPGRLVVGPDAESEPWARAWGEALACPHKVLAKVRRGDRDVRLAGLDRADVAGRRVLLVDDVASSGTTLARAARLAARCGALGVDAAV
ncbi:MAG TPA: ribose-phosphate diphosphokinase, partial [Caulobacteraceae bacterium]|nr:ribose-phosphate diphosphokinase [Caulobacteraceae bacterium]